MTRRWARRLAWVGVALCVVALTLGVTERLTRPQPGALEQISLRLRNGMTYQEVCRLVKTETAPSGRSDVREYGSGFHGGLLYTTWCDGQGSLTAAFAGNRLDNVEFVRNRCPSFRDRLRALLGW
jgi:hypothetical protein